jgi:hypothetical protein
VSAPADRLRAGLREAEADLQAGTFAGLEDGGAGLARLVETAREEAIGAAPARVADLAAAVERAHDEARRRLHAESRDTRRRLRDLLAATWEAQAGAGPAAAALRPARREAVAALAAAGGAGALSRLKRAAAALDTAAAAAAALRPGALARRADERRAEAATWLRTLDLLLHPDLRGEERAFLEAGWGLPGDQAVAAEAVAAQVRAVEAILEDRRAAARGRLGRALEAARRAGVPASELEPATAAAPGVPAGAGRLLGAAARIETLAAARAIEPLVPRLAAALAAAWRRVADRPAGPDGDALRAAVEDLRLRVAGESAAALTEALDRLEGMLAAADVGEAAGGVGAAAAGGSAPGGAAAAGTGRSGPAAAVPATTAADVALIGRLHPGAAAAWESLSEWARGPGGSEVEDLLEQIVHEARSPGGAAAAPPRGRA